MFVACSPAAQRNEWLAVQAQLHAIEQTEAHRGGERGPSLGRLARTPLARMVTPVSSLQRAAGHRERARSHTGPVGIDVVLLSPRRGAVTKQASDQEQ
jgi:hypothetical protein